MKGQLFKFYQKVGQNVWKKPFFSQKQPFFSLESSKKLKMTIFDQFMTFIGIYQIFKIPIIFHSLKKGSNSGKNAKNAVFDQKPLTFSELENTEKLQKTSFRVVKRPPNPPF
jgi:hypothetical protein